MCGYILYTMRVNEDCVLQLYRVYANNNICKNNNNNYDVMNRAVHVLQRKNNIKVPVPNPRQQENNKKNNPQGQRERKKRKKMKSNKKIYTYTCVIKIPRRNRAYVMVEGTGKNAEGGQSLVRNIIQLTCHRVLGGA